MGTDRTETERAIMEATYEALADRGYADLTIQAIADRFPKSKSLLYYHYETKEAIVTDFLEFLLDQFQEEVAVPEGTDPVTRLDAFLDQVLPREFDTDERDFRVALVEFQMQATHDDRIRRRFADIEDALHASLRAIVADGIERGAFRDVDPDEEADVLLSIVSGGTFRAATTGQAGARVAREAVDRYVERALQ